MQHKIQHNWHEIQQITCNVNYSIAEGNICYDNYNITTVTTTVNNNIFILTVPLNCNYKEGATFHKIWNKITRLQQNNCYNGNILKFSVKKDYNNCDITQNITYNITRNALQHNA